MGISVQIISIRICMHFNICIFILVYRMLSEHDIYFMTYFLGNTSNMNGHLKSKHKNTLLSNENKPKGLEASVSEIPEASTSKIHDIPASSIEQNKDHTVSNETFMGAFKRQKTISESFGVMASFKEGGVKSEKIIHAIMFMICKDNQPLSIVEDEGFKYLMKTVSPNFKVPSRR